MGGMEMNGVYKFAFLWSCGCLMAERAIRQLQMSKCPNCDVAFKSEDVILVHAEGEDLKLMQSRLEAKLAHEALKKENKKRNSSKMSETSNGNKTVDSTTHESTLPIVQKKIKSSNLQDSELNTREMKQSSSFKSLFTL